MDFGSRGRLIILFCVFGSLGGNICYLHVARASLDIYTITAINPCLYTPLGITHRTMSGPLKPPRFFGVLAFSPDLPGLNPDSVIPGLTGSQVKGSFLSICTLHANSCDDPDLLLGLYNNRHHRAVPNVSADAVNWRRYPGQPELHMRPRPWPLTAVNGSDTLGGKITFS